MLWIDCTSKFLVCAKQMQPGNNLERYLGTDSWTDVWEWPAQWALKLHLKKKLLSVYHRCILVPVMYRGGVGKKTFFKRVASQKWCKMQRLVKVLADFTVCNQTALKFGHGPHHYVVNSATGTLFIGKHFCTALLLVLLHTAAPVATAQYLYCIPACLQKWAISRSADWRPFWTHN